MDEHTYILSFLLLAVLLLPAGHMAQISGSVIEDEQCMTSETEAMERVNMDMLVQGADHFTRNVGQVSNPDILFYSQAGSIRTGFMRNGLSIVIPGEGGGFSYRVEFMGGVSNGPEGRSETMAKSNFLIGSDPLSWHVDVPTYEKMIYQEVWSGIDIEYRSEKGVMKYDVIVRPGGSPEDIRFVFEGVKPELEDGILRISTPVGNVLDDAPISFQDGTCIPSEWYLDPDGCASFRVYGHDPKRELLIDPGLRFSSFAGGSSADSGRSLAIDTQGYMYITGYTASTTFPTTTGAFDTDFNGGSNGDAFVLKVNVSGDALVFSTYLGGSLDDQGQGVDVDAQGNVYVGGHTKSNNFPVKSGFDTTYSFGWDVFVTKLSSSGNSIDYSTYLGGYYDDIAYDIKVVDSYCYVTGSTGPVPTNWPDQWKYPTTVGAYDRVHNGNDDVFVTKISQNGASLSYSTLVGHSSNEAGYAIDVDTSGYAYVGGGTTSSSFPTTSGASDTTHNGNEDGFVLKLSTSGNSLMYSTFLGGAGYDRAQGIELDSLGRAYTTGQTGSSNFPTTTKGYDTTYGGSDDAFLSLLSSSGDSLLNSTYIGGSGQDAGWSVVLGPDDKAYVTGETYSSNYPTTSDAFSRTQAGGADVFVTRVDLGGTGLEYSTFIGGSNDDVGREICVDSMGFIYLTGETNSKDYPTTFTAFDRTHNSNDDVFFTKFYPADFSPSGLRSTAGFFFVDLTWNPPSNPIVMTYPVQGYIVYRGISQNSLVPIASIGPVTHFNDTINDFTSRTYQYFVTAVLATIGEGGGSNMVNSTPDVTPPPVDPVSVAGDMFVNLTWSLMDEFYLDMFDVDYTIYRGLTPFFLVPVAAVGESGFYNDTDVPPVPVTFNYQISYRIPGVGMSNRTIIVQGRPRTPPGGPEGLSISSLDMAMNLSWEHPVDDGGCPVESYSVLRGQAPGSFLHVANLSPSQMTYIDTDIVPGSTYYYTVTSTNRLGTSVMANTVEGIGQTVPSPPSRFNLLPLDQKIKLEWSPPEFDWGTSITSYRVYRGSNSDDLILQVESGGNARTFTDAVTNGVSYHYAVTASNEHGESSMSGPIDGMATGVPGVVANVTFRTGDSMVHLLWDAPVNDGGLPITSYKVQRGPKMDLMDEEFLLASGALSFIDTGLENGMTYYYKVLACNNNGGSAPSATVIATPGRVSDRINRLNIDGGLMSASLSWSNPEDTGGREGLNIRIYRGVSASSLAPHDVIPFDSDTYLDLDLIPGEIYYYSLSVLNPIGEGPRSPVVSSIIYGPPSEPTIISYITSSREVNISWTPPDHDGGLPITGYRIGIRHEGEADWETVDVTGTDHSFHSLSQGIIYELRVSAFNTLSVGEPTDIIKTLVGDPPEEPRDLRVESLKPEIRVKWSARPQISLPVLGYMIYMRIGDDDPFLYATVDSSAVDILIDGLIQGEQYGFAVSAFNAIGEGKKTPFRSIVPVSRPEPVPLVWVSKVGDGMVQISWVAPEHNGGLEITGYTMFKGTTEEAPNQLAVDIIGNSYIDEEVINGRTYFYRVRAENGESSQKSEPVEAHPLGSPRNVQAFEGSPATDRVVLSWVPPSSDGGSLVTEYIISRGKHNGDMEVLAHLSANLSGYTDRSVTAGSYIYRVEAVNHQGIGEGVDIDVEVPSRTIHAVISGGIGIFIPIVILMLVLFLPGYLGRRREKKERMAREAKEDELRIRRMRAEELAGRSYRNGLRGAPAFEGTVHHHPAMNAPVNIPVLPHAQDLGGKAGGYIRPNEKKKGHRDRKNVLRADGKSLEHRMKEEDLKDSLVSKDDHKGKHWESERRKVLEEEASKVFTGQQADERSSGIGPGSSDEGTGENERQVAPTIEGLIDDMPVWDEDEEIPTWGEEAEEIEEIPLAKVPGTLARLGIVHDIDDMEELEELDELEELEELEELDELEE
ncbi:MAG: fibronectin type III domain-containing protein [Candidatus Thermoplasmatota archaeon]|nr:fibronectin type III domain-containing protein [Candidatus Thermoplasmatota archaeon]